ncbi:MAG: type 4a pilus biogenesis protein PilO [Candidatus Aureabacteria bacterium]|nr:type 4a pilus biogenesis protein PilO [Candidatus Auribacterota bacterium]
MKWNQVKLFNLFVLSFALSFLIFIVFPKGRDNIEMQKKIELTRIKINNGKRAVMHQSSLKKSVSTRKIILMRFKKLFIKEQEQPVVYQILNKTAKKVDVTILSIKPQPQDMSEEIILGTEITYRILPLRIELSGKYKDLAFFCDALTHASKYFVIKSIECNKSDNGTLPIKSVLLINEYLLINNE